MCNPAAASFGGRGKEMLMKDEVTSYFSAKELNSPEVILLR